MTIASYPSQHPSVEALRFNIQNVEEVAKFCGGRIIDSATDGKWIMFTDHTGRSQTAVPSDYVAKYGPGKFARYDAPTFEREYDVLGGTVGGDYVLVRRPILQQQDLLDSLHERLGITEETQGHTAQRQNAEFHAAFGIKTPSSPQAIPADQVPVVIELIREEFVDELIPALGVEGIWTESGKFAVTGYHEPNVVEIYDALIDILYVTYGALNRAGMDAAPGYNEVHGSNMSKLGEDGKPIIAGPNDPDGVFEGRVKKGPRYYKPDLSRVLNELAVAADRHEDPLAWV
ncbi:MazG-like nucleotide pyrophosphohydrolase [Microbacterium phage McGalleon]|uniref:MazG-like nucleotide pyrophosphohydrolase n=1 Tax=Microbacterium phage McGalleon TaxID=2590936 RepID=A0A516KQY0_9CAUD|nr:nucleotide pyrophosphohydrolase [Microbacterium phage McGalleon]QDP44098.1 MazG-like nucleotide pyrophosphohydrolase [Microbacterium phage McGalleon]